MLKKKKQLNKDDLNSLWYKTMPDCGKTLKKTFKDNEYNLEWLCLYNYKRMLRRTKRKVKDNCSFCLASKSDDNKLFSLANFNIYGNRYPIEPMHCLFFNNQHKIDPSYEELVELLELSENLPTFRILLSNRRGSGASIPNHLHIHAFLIEMPIEKARIADTFVTKDAVVEILDYPAWTVRISNSKIQQKANLLSSLMLNYKIPFNISFIGQDIYIIPRNNESPEICKTIIDGVGSLETAGVYTATSEKALDKVNLDTFHEGLKCSGFIEDIEFQKKFISYCIKVLEENEKNTY